ncbi:hypothetical protein ACHAXS_007922 [Conticribra weissflogii]
MTHCIGFDCRGKISTFFNASPQLPQLNRMKIFNRLPLSILLALASARSPSSMQTTFVATHSVRASDNNLGKIVSLAPSSTIPNSRRRETLFIMAKKKRKKASDDLGDLNDPLNAKGNPDHMEGKDGDSEINNDKISSNQIPKQTTLSGGPSLIFEMARRMLVWDDELYQGLNDAGSRGDFSADTSAAGNAKTGIDGISSQTTLSLAAFPTSSSPLPRWRPNPILQQSISNINPSFRTSSPVMTNAGYAGILRRNSRKKKKPSMWRHCLRVYGKMEELEASNDNEWPDKTSGVNGRSRVQAVNVTVAGGTASASGRKRKKPNIQRSTPHHEAALVAASKLGMWEEAVKIFYLVEQKSLSNRHVENATSKGANKMRRNVVTDNMVLSVISACVKGSRVKRTTSSVVVAEEKKMDVEVVVNANETDINLNATVSDLTNDDNLQLEPQFIPPVQSRIVMRTLSVEERRRPLDVARDIILSMEVSKLIDLKCRTSATSL